MLVLAENLSDYLTVLKIAVNAHTMNEQYLKKVYMAYFRFVENPEVFEDITQLIQVDAYHQMLYLRLPSHILINAFKLDISR